MRRGIVIGVAALGLTMASASWAEVNCKFVMKNLSLPGRTVQSVAETMSISEDEVKKCQDQAAQEGNKGEGKGDEKPAGEAK